MSDKDWFIVALLVLLVFLVLCNVSLINERHNTCIGYVYNATCLTSESYLMGGVK